MRIGLGLVVVLLVASASASPSVAAPGVPRGWRAIWNRDTGVAERLWGSFVDAPGAVDDGAVAERAARAFLARHLALLAPGTELADFTVGANQLDGELRTVGLVQTWHGMRVRGGELGFVFGRDRLFAIGSSAWPRVRASVPAAWPNAAAQRARAAAWITAQTGVPARARGLGAREILPIVTDGAIHYHVVDVVDVVAATGPECWDVLVAADGTPLARHSRVMSATGMLEYNAGARYPGSTRVDFPASNTAIAVNAVSTTTSTTGAFSWPGTLSATVAPTLDGSYVTVTNAAGPNATDSLTVQPGQTVAWSLAGDEFGDAQLASYVYANLAKARARVINPSVAGWLDAALAVYVNELGQECNATASKTELHFQRASASCENTGRLADVVFHEFGHALHYNSVIVGMGATELQLSEGLADFFAANLNDDPAIGRGLLFDNTPLRDIDPVGSERVYPDDLDASDPHLSGLIIAGALWDLRKALIKTLGIAAGTARSEKIFTGVMQHASNIATTFTAALIADDDDADLGNGTPNYCALERAFGQHGLVPDYVTTTVSPPIVEQLAISLDVNIPVTATCTPAAVAAIAVTWRAGDGVPSTFELAPQGTLWSGAFPAQLDDTQIWYRVEVTFDDGNVQVFPNNPADPSYQLYVGPTIPILCEPFDQNPNWSQSSNAGFEWQWATPEGRAGDPPFAYTGTEVVGTDLTSDGAYRPNLVASIGTPVVDVSKFDRVHLQYWRWLVVEDARYDRATIVASSSEAWSNASSQAGTLDHVDREWRFHDIDLTPFVVDGAIDVTWSLTSDGQRELGGWTIDDACIVGITELAICGDGRVERGERCDDGNRVDDDGCSATCVDEISAGGGGCCDAGNGGSPGWLLVALFAYGCSTLAARRRSSRWPSRSVSARMPK